MSDAAAWRAARAAAGASVAPPPDLAAPQLVAALVRHRLLGHARAVTGWSEPQRTALTPLWRASAARSLAHDDALRRARRALAVAGVVATPLKGITMQRALTGSPHGRDATDLDLWVHPYAYRAAARALLRDGWRLADGLQPRHLDAERLPSELSFGDEAGVTIDLHAHLFARWYALDDAARLVWRRRAPDGELDALSHGLIALWSGAKDGWPTLRHVADAALVARCIPHTTLAEAAQRTRTRRAFDVAFALADQLIGPTGWHPAEDVGGLVPSFIERLQAPRAAERAASDLDRYLRLRESWRSRLRALAVLPLQTAAADVDPRITRTRQVARRARRLARRYALDRTDGGPA